MIVDRQVRLLLDPGKGKVRKLINCQLAAHSRLSEAPGKTPVAT
jgi:hypothetical protein